MDAEQRDALTAWLVRQGLDGANEDAVVLGLCERLVDAGVPLQRAFVAIDILHPIVEASAPAGALDAAEAALDRVAELNARRERDGLPTDRRRPGTARRRRALRQHRQPGAARLHGGRPGGQRGGAHQAMYGSLEQPVIVFSAFVDAAPECRTRLVSLGRYMLRGVSRPQELFTLDPDARRSSA